MEFTPKNLIYSDFIFNPNIIVNGEIVGAWKRTFKKER